MKAFICLFALATPAFAAVAVSLPGNTGTAAWTGLTSANYGAPDYPVTYATYLDPWASPVAATSGSSTASFNKLSGGGYFSGTFMYTRDIGTFSIQESSPIASLETVVFQANMSEPTGDFAISLNYNGGSQAIAATYFSLSDNAAGYDDLAWQWDLSGISEPITSYEIVLSDHIAVTSMQLDSSDSHVQVIPEPSTGLLGIAALGLTLLRRRRA